MDLITQSSQSAQRELSTKDIHLHYPGILLDNEICERLIYDNNKSFRHKYMKYYETQRLCVKKVLQI